MTDREQDIAIIQQYIQMYKAGQVKLGLRVITKQEAEEREIPLLQAVAADIQFREPKP